MDFGLQGKVALVSAASKGLGKAAALALAREGARVSICARNEAALSAAAKEIRSATGVDVLTMPADVSKPEDVTRFVDNAAAHFGRIDILISNVGGPPSGTFETFSDADWQAAFNLTVMSPVRLIRAVLPHMRKAGGGRIVNIASSSVKEPISGLIFSNSLRPAVIGMTKTLSFELAKDNILINNVLPGSYDTDRIRELDEAQAARQGRPVAEITAEKIKSAPLGRRGDPSELAAMIVFLCSSQATFVTGTSIMVDGGSYKGTW
jgi:3-oxoacyl-[acyl-carrier protein] reductase